MDKFRFVLVFVFICVLCICSSCDTQPVQNATEAPGINTPTPSQPVASPTPERTESATSPVSTPVPTGTPKPEDIGKIDDIKPVFSLKGGVYNEKQSLTISLSEKDKAILALNGIKEYSIRVSYTPEEPKYSDSKHLQSLNIPHASSIKDQNGKITTSIVRAAVFDNKGQMIGKIETATYIKSDRNEDFTIPIISLVTNQVNLTDPEKGILTNYNGRGSEWERPAHFEFIEENGVLAFEQDSGIRMFGGSSRSLPQKSFRISARKSSYFNTTKYDGGGKFDYAFFPDRLKADGTLLCEYDSIVLRNGGNDSMVSGVQNERNSFIRDGIVALITQKAAPDVDCMAYRPVVLILNGEYYGILNMREHESENYVANVYDIEDKESIAIIASELDTTKGDRYGGNWFYYKLDDGPEDALAKYESVMKGIANGKYTFEEASGLIDMDNFLQYCAINIFVCNTDWPHNNIRLWKTPEGKYKFMIRDADLGMARYTLAASDPSFPSELYTKADAKNFRYLMWSELTSQQKNKLGYNVSYPSVLNGFYPDPLYIKGVLDFCLKNDGFRKDFLEYCQKLATEIWNADNLWKLVSDARDVLAQEMYYHFDRWSHGITASDYTYWYKNTIGESIKAWIDQRTGENGYFLTEVRAVCSVYD